MLIRPGSFISSASAGGGGAAPFDPADLAAVTNILDPSNGATVSADRNNPTPLAVNGGPVGRLYDAKAGLTWWRAELGGSEPVRTQDGAYWYLQFDGTNDRLIFSANSDTIITNSAYEVHMALAFDSVATDEAVSVHLNDRAFCDGTSTYFGAPYARSSGRVGGYNFDGSLDILDTAYTIGNVFQWSQRHAGGTLYAQFNDDAEQSVASGNTTSGLNTAMRLGGLGAVYPHMRFYAAVITNAALTTDERAAVRAWVASKAPIA